MRFLASILPLIPGLIGALISLTPATAQDAELRWDARRAEHLWNRAGFGARPGEIERWVAAGPEALVEHLLTPPPPGEPPVVPRIPIHKERLRRLPPEERRRRVNELRARNRDALRAWAVGWAADMLSGEAPLTERMTLFWHGVFTTQASKVKLAHELIGQNLLLREHALGNYGSLLRGILRDPAMLVYLDNVESEAGRPNENLARELLELFSLGEGNYTEDDVRAVARALTGHGADRAKGYRFDPRNHDDGRKTVLGVTGPLDLDDVVDAILEQPACARWVVRRLVTYLEGVPPEPERLERYAALLRDGDYELEPVLRALFLDPDFYRPGIVGARIASPIDYLIGSARRLGVEPPPAALVVGASVLGEQLFEPPSVLGWEGGEAWVGAADTMNRGSLAGMLLGVVRRSDLSERGLGLPARDDDEDGGDGELSLREVEEMFAELDMQMEPAMEPAMELGERRDAAPTTPLLRVARVLETAGYAPRINLGARVRAAGLRTTKRAGSDAAIVTVLLDELLAIEAPADTRAALARELRRERKQRGLTVEELLGKGERGERILRRLAHAILSLPEAQLL